MGKYLPGRAKKDATKDHNQHRGKDERIEWHFMFRVNPGKEATRWKSSVSITFISMLYLFLLDSDQLTYLAKA